MKSVLSFRLLGILLLLSVCLLGQENRLQQDFKNPPKSARPVSIRPGGEGINRRSERHATDFPDPDSPTIPSVSPGVIENETSSTARTIPARV